MIKRAAGFILLVLAIVLTAGPLTAKIAAQHMVFDGRDVVYWEPWAPLDATKDSKQPLILLTHGFTGCNTQFTFLGQALAADGYWVFAPQHSDAGCGLIAKTHPQKAASFDHPEDWDDTIYADRGVDLRVLVRTLEADPRFKDKIDFTRIGVGGHSLGGATVMALAGAWPGWKPLPGLKAVAAYSPYAAPFYMHKTLGHINVPIMYQGGTSDTFNSTWLKKADGVYEATPAPKYLIVFNGAEHRAWTSDDPSQGSFYPAIISYTEAFFDHYVKGLPALPGLTASRPDVAEFHYDSDLGKGDPINDKK